jgi:putative colanic acid biosynthesis acetyltransferase WcaF
MPPQPPRIFLTLDKTARAPYPRTWYFKRIVWRAIYVSLFRLPIPKGSALRRTILRIMGAKIGNVCYIPRTVDVFHPWLLEIGDYCALSDRVTLYNLGPLKIGDHTVLSQDVYVCGGTHDYTKPDLPLIRPTNIIGSGVWIAAGAFIGPGVTIGDNSVVAARAVVTKDVAANTVVGGNPARFIKARPMGHAPTIV